MRKTWKSLTALALSAAMVFSNSALVVNAEEVQPEKAVSDIEQPEKVEAVTPEENSQRMEDIKEEIQDSKQETDEQNKVLPEAQERVEETAQESEKLEDKKETAVKEDKLKSVDETTEEGSETTDTTDTMRYSLDFDYEKLPEDMLVHESVVLDADTFSVWDNENDEETADYQLVIQTTDVWPENNTARASVNEDRKSITVTSGGEAGSINLEVIAKIGDKKTNSIYVGINISDIYYTLKAPKINNINVGETLDLNTIPWALTKTYKEADEKKEVAVDMAKEGITLKMVCYDTDTSWETTDKETGPLPEIVRNSSNSVSICVEAYDKEDILLAQTYIAFENIYYLMDIRYSYGYENLYPDAPLTLEAYEFKNEYEDNNMPLPEGCTYEWAVDESELSDGASVQWEKGKDEKSMVITGSLSETDANVYQIPVTLTVKRDGEYLTEATGWLELKNSTFSRYDSFFSNGTALLGVEHAVKRIGGYLESAEYPAGNDTFANITNIESGNPDIMSVSKSGNEWRILAKKDGTVDITFTVDADVLIGKTFTETVKVVREQCDIRIEAKNGVNRILPGETIGFDIVYAWEKYVEDETGGWVEDKNIKDLILDWKISELVYDETIDDNVPGEAATDLSCAVDSKNPEILRVTADKNVDLGGEYGRSVCIGVEAYEKAEDGTKGKLLFKNDDLQWLSIGNQDYRIIAGDIYAHPGDKISTNSISAVLKHYTVDSPNGTVVKDAKIVVDYLDEEFAVYDAKKGMITIKENALEQFSESIILKSWIGLYESKYEESGGLNVLIHRPQWSAWKTSRPANTSAPEQQTRTCSICKKSETRTVGSKLTPYLNLTANSLKMKVKQKTTAFKVTGMAKGDYVKSVVSSNKKVLKVSGVKSNGTFKLSAQKKKGTAKLTITTAYGAKKTIKVTVQSKAVKTTKISGLSKKVTLKKGKTVKLKPVIAPVTSQDKITYKTSNKKVATVSKKGVVKGKKAGKAKITVKSGSKKYTVTVVVTK